MQDEQLLYSPARYRASLLRIDACEVTSINVLLQLVESGGAHFVLLERGWNYDTEAFQQGHT